MLAFAASLGAAASLGTGAARAASADAVTGAWELVSFNMDEGTGKEKPRFGPDPKGYLMYTPAGRMSAVLTGIHRPPLEPPPKTSADAAQCVQSVADFLAYAGRYEVQGDRVLHHIEVCVFTNLIGTTVIRQFKIEGDTLTIRTLPPEIWGSSNILVWKRSQSQS